MESGLDLDDLDLSLLDPAQELDAAGQIEGAVVERIACIGRDPGLLQETLALLRTIKAARQPAHHLQREAGRVLDQADETVLVERHRALARALVRGESR